MVLFHWLRERGEFPGVGAIGGTADHVEQDMLQALHPRCRRADQLEAAFEIHPAAGLHGRMKAKQHVGVGTRLDHAARDIVAEQRQRRIVQPARVDVGLHRRRDRDDQRRPRRRHVALETSREGALQHDSAGGNGKRGARHQEILRAKRNAGAAAKDPAGAKLVDAGKTLDVQDGRGRKPGKPHPPNPCASRFAL
jgi:hypothetical protein